MKTVAPTAGALLAMSPAERGRLLAAQAEGTAQLYNEDLSRPIEQRELIAFTALDGEPFDGPG